MVAVPKLIQNAWDPYGHSRYISQTTLKVVALLYTHAFENQGDAGRDSYINEFLLGQMTTTSRASPGDSGRSRLEGKELDTRNQPYEGLQYARRGVVYSY